MMVVAAVFAFPMASSVGWASRPNMYLASAPPFGSMVIGFPSQVPPPTSRSAAEHLAKNDSDRLIRAIFITYQEEILMAGALKSGVM